MVGWRRQLRLGQNESVIQDEKSLRNLLMTVCCYAFFNNKRKCKQTNVLASKQTSNQSIEEVSKQTNKRTNKRTNEQTTQHNTTKTLAETSAERGKSITPSTKTANRNGTPDGQCRQVFQTSLGHESPTLSCKTNKTGTAEYTHQILCQNRQAQQNTHTRSYVKNKQDRHDGIHTPDPMSKQSQSSPLAHDMSISKTLSCRSEWALRYFMNARLHSICPRRKTCAHVFINCMIGASCLNER